MLSVTRRGFLRSTSLSIAAVGALGAIPALANASPSQAQAEPAPLQPMPLPTMPMSGRVPFTVYVSDPSTGMGTILVGERAIPFTNNALVQSFRQAIG
jgi:hypothetical protein